MDLLDSGIFTSTTFKEMSFFFKIGYAEEGYCKMSSSRSKIYLISSLE